MSKMIGTADYERGARQAEGQTKTGSRLVSEATDKGIGVAGEQFGKGIGATKQYLGQALGQISPYQQVGTEALDMYRNMVLGGDMGGFQASPGYQFQLGQGLKAIGQQGSATGTSQSGAQQKALMEYGQGLANQEYQNYLGQVGGLAGQGLQASQLAGGYLTGTGQNQANLYGQLGQTQAGLYGNLGQTQANLYGQLGQTQASMQAGKGALKGKLFGQAMKMLGGSGEGEGEGGGAEAVGQAFAGSDLRLKQNITRTGVKKNGIEIVEFNYNEKSGKDTSKRWRGVIAQEVEKVMPKAVIEKDGFKHVDYSMIGIEMEEI